MKHRLSRGVSILPTTVNEEGTSALERQNESMLDSEFDDRPITTVEHEVEHQYYLGKDDGLPNITVINDNLI